MVQLRRNCPVCGESSGEELYTQHFAEVKGSPLPKTNQIVCCDKCGFVFVENEANQDVYDLYYEQYSKYEDLQVSSGTGSSELDRTRLEKTADDISEYLTTEHEPKILDMGCANGGLLASLKRRGYENVYGVDPSLQCVKHTRSLGIPAEQGTIFNFAEKQTEYLPKKFDCIILSHVLEHVFDLHSTVNKLLSYLEQDGILYIEVPDASAYSKYYQVSFYYFDTEHINHFDENSLKNLFSFHGCSMLAFMKKEIEVHSNNMYPCVFCIFRFDKSNKGNIEKTIMVRETILDYLSRSQKELTSESLSKIKGEKIIIWGAGNYALRLLGQNFFSENEIVFFVDGDQSKVSKKIDKYEIKSPESITQNSLPVVICSALFADDIRQRMIDMGVSKSRIVIL